MEAQGKVNGFISMCVGGIFHVCVGHLTLPPPPIVSHTSSRTRLRLARSARAYARHFASMYSLVAARDIVLMPP